MIRRIDPSEFPEDPPEEGRLSEPPPAPEQPTPKAGDLRARIEQIRKLAAEGRLDPGDLPAFDAAAAPPEGAPKGGRAAAAPPAAPPHTGYPVPLVTAVPCPVPPLADYIEQLKRTVAGESIVHERTIPPQPEARAERIDHLGPGVEQVVEAAGVGRLYSHQEEALRHIGEGRNVVVATPTASGKSLIYNAAVLSSLLATPAAAPSTSFRSRRSSRTSTPSCSPCSPGSTAGQERSCAPGSTTATPSPTSAAKSGRTRRTYS